MTEHITAEKIAKALVAGDFDEAQRIVDEAKETQRKAKGKAAKDALEKLKGEDSALAKEIVFLVFPELEKTTANAMKPGKRSRRKKDEIDKEKLKIAEYLKEFTPKVSAFLKKKPASKIEAIRDDLDITDDLPTCKKALTETIQTLIKSGKVKTEGKRRSVTYSLA